MSLTILRAGLLPALLPTVGGQMALNTAVELAESGILEKYGVEYCDRSVSMHDAAGRAVAKMS